VELHHLPKRSAPKSRVNLVTSAKRPGKADRTQNLPKIGPVHAVPYTTGWLNLTASNMDAQPGSSVEQPATST